MSPTTRHSVRYWADPHTIADSGALLPDVAPSATVRSENNLQIRLPDLAPGDLVLPSFASRAEGEWQFQATLDTIPLPSVPSLAAAKPSASSTDHGTLATHLDWFEIKQPLTAPTLRISTDAQALASAHLLVVSVRPLHIAAPMDAPITTAAKAPPTISQQQAPAAIKDRICSPTALAMVLGHQQRQLDWLSFVSRCKDPATGMYGLWPLCILRAAQAGSLGAVRTFSAWSEVTPLLAADIPVVASIRYAKDALPGAPMAGTSGHLVVVYGVDADWVLVNDPAAPDHDAVPRRYPRVAFERAWFEHRGAGYVLLPG